MSISRNTIVVLNATLECNKAGVFPTIGEVAKLTGLSYYKVQKELRLACSMKWVIDLERPHRPNVNKRVWLVAKSIRETVKEWYNAQF